jgi:hypothetical protein
MCTVPHTNLLQSLLTMREPKGFKSAVRHPDLIAAMEEEIQAFH